MSSMIRLAFLIVATLIVTGLLAIHRSETAFARPYPICYQCNLSSLDEIAALREQCDSLAGGIGILRPVNQTDSTEDLQCCSACPDVCEYSFSGGMPSEWICLGL